MRVKFAAQMNPKRRKYLEAMNTTPLRTMMCESPHKLYVGNLAWTVQPEDLRNYFSQLGNVTSARVVHDRKEGKTRAYGFISFASASERDAANSLNGTVSVSISYRFPNSKSELTFVFFFLYFSFGFNPMTKTIQFHLQEFSGRKMIVRKGREREGYCASSLSEKWMHSYQLATRVNLEDFVVSATHLAIL